MLQNNIFTGLLFFAGVFYSSWLMGTGAVVGAAVSTYTAYILKYNSQDIENGLYGFNGILVGIAVLFFYELTPLTILLIIIGSVLSSLIMHSMHERKLYPFTFPFVLSTWILIVIVKFTSLVPSKISEIVVANSLNIISSLAMSFSQVMFQPVIVTGILFFLGLVVSSRIVAVYALIGPVFGMILAYALSFPIDVINMGLFGYNGVLCGVVFAEKKVSSFFYALLSIFFSVAIVYGFMAYNFAALTAPFVFASWTVLFLKK
jgi:urea transporter